MLIAAASVLSLVGFFLLSAVLPRERLRGVVASIVVCAQFVGWSLVVPLPIRNAVIVASLLLLVLSALSPRTQPARRTPILPLCVAFFACTLVTTAITNPDGAGLIGRVGSFSCLLVVVVTQFSSKDAQAFRDGIVATAGLQAVFGLIEFFVTHAPVLWGYKVYANGRASYNENPSSATPSSASKAPRATGSRSPRFSPSDCWSCSRSGAAIDRRFASRSSPPSPSASCWRERAACSWPPPWPSSTSRSRRAHCRLEAATFSCSREARSPPSPTAHPSCRTSTTSSAPDPSATDPATSNTCRGFFSDRRAK
ncbi:hypothetical protein [Frondihabitans sucicola]|uniref:hypothetical protein n=1 Tax=Frondihabitans sucicola TaxID=1268041 RepID=UPI0025748D10|nr:hypothetical protein [Frondihabitans sucicola]